MYTSVNIVLCTKQPAYLLHLVVPFCTIFRIIWLYHFSYHFVVPLYYYVAHVHSTGVSPGSLYMYTDKDIKMYAIIYIILHSTAFIVCLFIMCLPNSFGVSQYLHYN